jgi:hypothetical protein
VQSRIPGLLNLRQDSRIAHASFALKENTPATPKWDTLEASFTGLTPSFIDRKISKTVGANRTAAETEISPTVALCRRTAKFDCRALSISAFWIVVNIRAAATAKLKRAERTQKETRDESDGIGEGHPGIGSRRNAQRNAAQRNDAL